MRTITELNELTGGLSSPSKMPCHSFSLPASTCKRGAELAKIKGTVCNSCYAMKGRYRFRNVQSAQQRRYDLLMADKHNAYTKWGINMLELIHRKEKSGYFRWHDSGDIQDVEHLATIDWIAHRLSDIQFWLPTREHGIVHEYTDKYELSPNLVVRISSDAVRNIDYFVADQLTSSVNANFGWQCPAPSYRGKCNKCRACWQRNIKNVDYALH